MKNNCTIVLLVLSLLSIITGKGYSKEYDDCKIQIGAKSGIYMASWVFKTEGAVINDEYFEFQIDESNIGEELVGGFYMTYWKNKHLAYQLELIKTSKDIKMVSDNYNYNHHSFIQYLELPVLLKLAVLERNVCVYGGGFLAVKIRETFFPGAVTYSTKPYDYGIIYGIELSYQKDWLSRPMIDIRYELSIPDIAYSEKITVRNSMLIISAGVSLTF